MAVPATGKKDKLKITVCNVENGIVSIDSSKEFEFILNPSVYEHAFEIGYSQKVVNGQSASNTKFSATKPETLKISTLIDCSGVIGGEAGSKDLKTQLKELTDIVYRYEGDKHEPNHVRVLWGSQIFFGRLETISVDKTLFKANGEPLRAKLQLQFKQFMTNEEEALRANRSSPDLSHLVEVKAGDTLPLLCYRIYKDSSYYLEVARYNNITEFRDLEPGSKLHFPPLR